MNIDTVEYEPIGVVRTPYDTPDGMPIQPTGARETQGTVELTPEYGPALADLDGFSHCILLYHFHESDPEAQLTVEPFLDDTERGLFSTRAPRRPNAIGLSVVEIIDIEGTELTVRGIDVVDETPLLDIKPLVPAFDIPDDTEVGWLDTRSQQAESRRADDRFLE